MTSPRTGTPALDNQPQTGIPRAAGGRDAGTPGQQIPGGEGKGEGGAGEAHPPWAPLATSQRPFRRSLPGSGSRLSAPVLVPMPPKVPSRGIQVPPRPAQTQLLWVWVTALLSVAVPIRCRCQLRFRETSPAPPRKPRPGRWSGPNLPAPPTRPLGSLRPAQQTRGTLDKVAKEPYGSPGWTLLLRSLSLGKPRSPGPWPGSP
nr:uncharacterized protein LOC100967292 isoform X2 [Pan paniscus]